MTNTSRKHIKKNPDTSRKTEKQQINKLRNEKGEVTTDNAEMDYKRLL